MGEMKNLYTQGVRDVESYLIGRENQREDIIHMIRQALDNPALEIEKLSARMALAVIVGAIQWNGEEETKGTKEEN